MARQERARLASMRIHVPSLASLSGLGILRCRELWCRSIATQLRSRVAVALVQAGGCSSASTLSLGTSICRGCGPKKQNVVFSLLGLLLTPDYP